MPIVYENYNVSQVTKKTTPSLPTDLESLPIGTQFMCYPQQEFDFIARGQWQTSEFLNLPIHISSMTAVLTEKDSFEVFSIDPTIGMANQGTYLFRPYTTTLTISGYVDPSFGAKTIQIAFSTNIDSDISWSNPTPIDENGYFTVIEERYWNSPVTIWFGGAYISYSDWVY
ncbi:MAG: hypothetical protein K0M69_08555 [Youngiibacter sp.]|nr:hypothetical protein [Youngiibacter sp.]